MDLNKMFAKKVLVGRLFGDYIVEKKDTGEVSAYRYQMLEVDERGKKDISDIKSDKPLMIDNKPVREGDLVVIEFSISAFENNKFYKALNVYSIEEFVKMVK